MFAKVKQKMINSHCAKHLNLKKKCPRNVVKKKQVLSSFDPRKNPRKVSVDWYGGVVFLSRRNWCPPNGVLPVWEAVVEPPVLTAQTLHERTARFRTCSLVDSAKATALWIYYRARARLSIKRSLPIRALHLCRHNRPESRSDKDDTDWLTLNQYESGVLSQLCTDK